MELKRIAIDTSKHVFTIHGIDVNDRPVLRQELRRGRVEAFIAKRYRQPMSCWRRAQARITLGGWATG